MTTCAIECGRRTAEDVLFDNAGTWSAQWFTAIYSQSPTSSSGDLASDLLIRVRSTRDRADIIRSRRELVRDECLPQVCSPIPTRSVSATSTRNLFEGLRTRGDIPKDPLTSPQRHA